MDKTVLCVGSLVIDMVNAPLARNLGSVEGASTTFGIYLGGNACNVTIDLQQLGWPADQIVILGTAGTDYFGEFIQQGLKQHGIVSRVQLVPGVKTAKNIILQVEGEEPRDHFDGTAPSALSLDLVLSTIRELRPTIFCIGEVGILGETGMNLKTVLQAARETGCVTVVDMLYPPNGDLRYFTEAAPFMDVLHCNEGEARYFTGKSDLREIAETLEGYGVTLPLVTLAENGVVCAYKEMIHSCQAFKVNMINPTGAGDAFTAGMIKKLLEFEGCTLQEKLGETPEKLLEAVRYGMAAGACCVTALGCTQAVREANVLDLLGSQV